MAKPSEYRDIYVLNTDVTYQDAAKASAGDTFNSHGVLERGRVVWAPPRAASADPATVSVYAEGVGVVTLAPECLQRSN